MRGQRQRIAAADSARIAAADSAAASSNLREDSQHWQLPQCLLELWALGKMSPQTLQQVPLIGGVLKEVGQLDTLNTIVQEVLFLN